MLVLSRKIGEDVVIRNDIVVRILDVKGSKVKIGFGTSDPSVEINRIEVEFSKLQESDDVEGISKLYSIIESMK
jgi:carbon storage regulator CsrA